MECVLIMLGEHDHKTRPNQMHFTGKGDMWGNVRRVMRDPKTLGKMMSVGE